jgi:hypothetical protein
VSIIGHPLPGVDSAIGHDDLPLPMRPPVQEPAFIVLRLAFCMTVLRPVIELDQAPESAGLLLGPESLVNGAVVPDLLAEAGSLSVLSLSVVEELGGA